MQLEIAERIEAKQDRAEEEEGDRGLSPEQGYCRPCLLYTSDAADERSSVDLGGRRIIKKKKNRSICGREARRHKEEK